METRPVTTDWFRQAICVRVSASNDNAVSGLAMIYDFISGLSEMWPMTIENRRGPLSTEY